MNKYLADELFKRAYSHLQKKEFGKSSQLFEKLLKEIEEFHEEIKEYQRDTFDRQVVISMTPTFTSNMPPKIKSCVYPDFH